MVYAMIIVNLKMKKSAIMILYPIRGPLKLILRSRG